MKYDYKQLHYDGEMAEMGYAAYTVKGYKKDGYPKSSVCYGMTKIDFIDTYESVDDAVVAHPELVCSDGEVSWGSSYEDSLLKDVSHIPDEPDYQY